MKVFLHHIYELKKGLRRLVLHTCPAEDICFVEQKLNREGIPFLSCQVSEKKFNVFFGDPLCISVLKEFSTLALNELSDQEDFILGTLLGYDLKIQCSRFLDKVRTGREKHLTACTA